MRFPFEITDEETNETFPIMDQRMIFQLADVLNELNAGNDELQVEFLEWIQNAPNTPADTPFRRPDGTFPGTYEVETDPAYEITAAYHNATAAEEATAALDDVKGLDAEKVRLFATNIFAAYKQAKDEGLFDYSEVSYLRNVMKTDLNTTDEVTPSSTTGPCGSTRLSTSLLASGSRFRAVSTGCLLLLRPSSRTEFNTVQRSTACSTTKITIPSLYLGSRQVLSHSKLPIPSRILTM